VAAVLAVLTFVSLGTVLYVAIQQLEGNVQTPRIQGQASRVHLVVVLLAVIGRGGELAGFVGVIFGPAPRRPERPPGLLPGAGGDQGYRPERVGPLL
jgi:hypothetical protein